MSSAQSVLNFREVCRTCMVKREEMTDLRGSLFNGINISMMVVSCTSILITESDLLPTNICSDCISEALTAYKFKKKVEECDTKLRSYLQAHITSLQKCMVKIEEEELDPEDMYVKKIDLAEESATNCVIKKEPDCDNTVNSGADIEDAMESTVDSDNSDNSTFQEEVYIKNENVDRTEKTNCAESDQDLDYEDMDIEGIECVICKVKLDSKDLLLEHLKSHRTKRPHVCKCGKSFRHINNFIEHFGSQQEDKSGVVHELVTEPAILCIECGTGFSTPDELKEHVRLAHWRGKEHACVVCSKSFSRPKYLNQHLKTHTKRTCRKCRRTFESLKQLAEHQRNCSEEVGRVLKNEACDLCGKTFAARSSMKRHRLLHTGEKPFKCHLCPRGFIQSSELELHLTRHGGRRTFPCDVCGKVFAFKARLQQHSLLHSGELHSCTLCSKGYTAPGKLRRHMQSVHPEEFLGNSERRVHTKKESSGSSEEAVLKEELLESSEQSNS